MKKGNKRNPSKGEGALKTKVVELGFQADIVAAVEALHSNPDKQLALRLPDPPGDFGKFFNLRLLKQISLLLNKEIILITNNRTVSKLAEHLNIPVKAAKTASPAVSLSELPPLAPSNVGSSQRAMPSKYLPSPAYKTGFKQNTLKSKPARVGSRSAVGWIFLILIIAGAAVSLFIFYPKQATINIQTHVSALRVKVEADLSQTAQQVDVRRKILPLRMISQDSKLRQELEATGSTDGEKASGVIEIYNCNTRDDLVIDTQTIFRKDDKDFVLRADDLEIVIPPNNNPDDCESSSALDNRRSLKIEAVNVGEEYNLEAGSYQIVGLDSDDYNVRGFDISGGSEVTSCITAEDLELAKEEFAQKRNDTEVKRDLMHSLEIEHNLIPLEGTFQVAEADILEPATCPEVTDNRISQVIIYYLGGIEKADVVKLIEADLKAAAGELTVVDDGLNSASYEVNITLNSERPKPTVQQAADLDYYVIIEIDHANATIVLDRQDILDEIAGEKVKQVAPRLRRLEGVTNVQVDLSPFWVDSLPENKNDILLKINDQEEDNPDNE